MADRRPDENSGAGSGVRTRESHSAWRGQSEGRVLRVRVYAVGFGLAWARCVSRKDDPSRWSMGECAGGWLCSRSMSDGCVAQWWGQGV